MVRMESELTAIVEATLEEERRGRLRDAGARAPPLRPRLLRGLHLRTGRRGRRGGDDPAALLRPTLARRRPAADPGGGRAQHDPGARRRDRRRLEPWAPRARPPPPGLDRRARDGGGRAAGRARFLPRLRT